METITPKAKAEKRLSQRERVLGLLIERGAVGATSEELNRIGFRYSSVIHALRAQGHNIETFNRKGTELARFVWWHGPGEATQIELSLTETP